MNELFWNATQEERMAGYYQKDGHYHCLLCDEKIEEGYVFPYNGAFVDAGKKMSLHIEEIHGGVLNHLTRQEKKRSGLSEQQRSILRLFYEGLSDQEVQKALNIGSISTVRNHRAILKDKERQAKTMTTAFELLAKVTEERKAKAKLEPATAMAEGEKGITEEVKAAIPKKHQKTAKAKPEVKPTRAKTKAHKEKKAKEVKESGVYQIRNMFNGKIYIGSTREINQLEGLKHQLNTRYFSNSTLQEDWNALGEESFAIEILEKFEEKGDVSKINERLGTMKKAWKEKLQPYGDKGYHRRERRG